MNTKKIAVILIAVAFSLVVIFSGIGILSVKKVQVNYALADETDSQEIQDILDGFLGANLLFFNTEEIKQSLKDHHYIEIMSIDKQYPNVLSVSVKERREVYYFDIEDKIYVTTAEGFVLNSFDKSEFTGDVSRDKIVFNLGDINVQEVELGQVIKTDNDALLSSVFEMAQSVKLTDCIKSITVKKVLGYDSVYQAEFDAYTGVKIIIDDVLVKGSEKAVNIFQAYNDELSDFEKNEGKIISMLMDDGRYRVTYVNESGDGVSSRIILTFQP